MDTQNNYRFTRGMKNALDEEKGDLYKEIENSKHFAPQNPLTSIYNSL
jgi:hypothetical protein